MKKTLRFIALFSMLAVMIVLTGCPVSTKYPLAANGSERIDESLIGTWKSSGTDPEVSKVTISQKNDYTYNVSVDEKGESYMADGSEFVGWLTTLSGKRFFVLQEMEGSTAKDKYYVYHIEIKGSSFVTHDVGLKKGGIDAVTSINAFREEVKASLGYSDCLSSPIEWTKAGITQNSNSSPDAPAAPRRGH